MEIEITKPEADALRAAQALASEFQQAVERWSTSTLDLLTGPPDSVAFARECPENARKLRAALDGLDPDRLVLKAPQRGAGAIVGDLIGAVRTVRDLLVRGKAPENVRKPIDDGLAWLDAFNAFVHDLSEAAAEAGTRAAKSLPGGGVHAHVLDESGATTVGAEVDGGHVHAVRLADGSVVLTGRDGAHGHLDGLDVPSGHHKHEFKLPDGRAIGSLDDGDHVHEADSGGRTTFGGVHQHEIEIDGERFYTLLPETVLDLDVEKGSIAPWQQYGGASQYADRLAKRLPDHETYVEPFAGAAAVLFAKSPAKREAIADLDSEVVFALRYLQKWSPARERALAEFDWTGSRGTFEKAKKVDPKSASADQRMWRFLYLRRFGFAGMARYSSTSEGTRYSFERLAKKAERLRDVAIEHADYKRTLEKYDSAKTLFFIDPPYPGEWDDRVGEVKGSDFDLSDFVERVGKLKGTWIVALGDRREHREALGKLGGKLFALSVSELTARNFRPGRRYFATNDKRLAKAVEHEIEKLRVGEIEPGTLRHVSDRELRSVNLRLHQLFGANFAGNQRMVAGDLNREDLVNAAIFVFREMHRRGFHVQRDSALWREAETLRTAKRATAITHPSGEGTSDPIVLADVLRHYEKPMILRSPIVSLVGGLVNAGETRNDIDLLVHGPIDEKLRRVIEFRLGRALPPGLSARAQFHDETLGGPFTDHAKLYDLVLVPRDDRRTIVEMADTDGDVEKQGDPLQEYPPTTGPRPGVVQLHTRGKSAHFDLRFKANDHLIGFTLFAAKPNAVPDVNTVAGARAVYAGYDAENGNDALKPVRAPAHLAGTPKSVQPVVWLGIEGRVFEPGEIGGTAGETGVMVAVAHPKVEWGLQLPHFHEWFLTGDRVWQGSLYVRMLVGQGGSEAEIDAGRRVPEGQAYWQAHIGKSYLPTVLKTRTVRTGRMPPLGRSAMPKSLEAVTPSEFRFWQAKTEKEARETRDALVRDGWFTEENVAIVNGTYQRIVRKSFLWVPEREPDPDPAPTAKAARSARYALSWLFWRGPMQVRTGPSRQVWLLLLDAKEGGGLVGWELQTDPTKGDATSAVQRRFTGKSLLVADQKVEPGVAIDGNVLNPTKATPAWIRQQEHGEARVLDETNDRIVLSIGDGGLRGTWTLTREEPGSPIWTLERGQHEQPRAKVEAPKRTDLKPGQRFRPMKPEGGVDVGEFRDLDPLLERWAIPEVLAAGIFVEPKLNGYRIVGSRDETAPDGKRVSIFFEDSQDERAITMPTLAAALDSIPGSWILDGELLDLDDKGEPLPRASLARFTQPTPQNDERATFNAFGVLFWDRAGGNLTEQDTEEQRKTLARFFNGKQALANGRVRLVSSKKASTEKALRDAIEWAKKVPGSEGAMFKLPDATYSLGGASSSWAKLKTVRRIDAIVYAKDPVAGSNETFVYSCAVGPVKESDGYVETVEIDGDLYAVIGRTGNTNVQAKIGDVVQVQVFELAVDRREGKRRVHWFGPPVVELARDDARPMRAEEVEGMATEIEIRKLIDLALDVRMPLVKMAEERFVLGVVLEPNDGEGEAPVDPDTQGDIYSAHEIRRAAHLFMEQYRNLGLMHRRIVPTTKLRILESFISPVGFAVRSNGECVELQDVEPGEKVQNVRRGTWLLAMRVVDDRLWEAVKAGKLTGLSIGGSARRVAERKPLTQTAAKV